MEVLADKTGYDADMIEEDMELETELGIDSIKRVEILSDVQNKLGIEAQTWTHCRACTGQVIAAMAVDSNAGGVAPVNTTSAARAAQFRPAVTVYPVQPEDATAIVMEVLADKTDTTQI